METSDNLNLKSDQNDQIYPPSIHSLNSRKLGETGKIERNGVMDLKFSSESEISNVDLKKPFSCKDDSEMKLPYDPLTNYLSPRPKFLRYNPCRRREIFLRRFGEENSEIDEEIQEEGEGDENRGWNVKELLKFLLVIASLLLCTAYIASMNSPVPSFEVSGAFRSGFCPILNNTNEFRSSVEVESLNVNGSEFWDEEVTEAASNMNSEGVSQFVHHEETEILNGGDLVMLEYTEHIEENGVEFSENVFEDDGDQENVKQSEISDTIRSEEDEIIEASNINGFDDDKLLSDIFTAAENEYISPMVAVQKEEAESFVLEASKITILERVANCISSFIEDFEKLKSELSELMHTETKSVLKAVLGLSVSSAILTCLLLSIKFKKKKDDKKEPAVTASVKPILLQSSVAEAEKVITRELPSIKPSSDVDRSNNEIIRNVNSFKMLSSSIHSRDEMESFKENYPHEVPTVQFLGEFVVGEVKSGSKKRTIEVQDSNFPVSVEEKPVSKNMNSGPEQALSEFSTNTSPTYGSLTSKKKIVKKEVGGDGEVKSITTPVRRSTRIRNRIVSP